MRFLVDANLPRSVVALLGAHGHVAEHVRDVGLGDAADDRIAQHAREVGAALITRDIDFADVRVYPPSEHAGIIVLRLEEHAIAADITRVVERFFRDAELVARIPGHLAIVDANRVRFRPALV